MGRVFLGLLLLPASVLLMWYALPIFKTVMVDWTINMGAFVGLDGPALFIANAMPVIVPVMCSAGIIACFIGIAKGRNVL